MSWRKKLKYGLAPAKVLSLIRDGKATCLGTLSYELGMEGVIPMSVIQLVEQHLESIVNDFAKAGLVTKEGENFAPTDLILRIQKALQISLTELSEAWSGEEKAVFVEPSLIEDLRKSSNKKQDLTKVVRFCEELNSSFSSGNYLASTLLIRALLNHIPPVFGHTTFQQVVSQSGRSVKELLKPLEEIARDVADLHTHSLIRHKESLPTKSQVEPFKANLEVLLHEVIAKVQEPDGTAKTQNT
jgi:hypothetical protein